MKQTKWLVALMLTFVMALAACTDDSSVGDDLEPDDSVEDIDDIDSDDEGPVEPADELDDDVEEDAAEEDE